MDFHDGNGKCIKCRQIISSDCFFLQSGLGVKAAECLSAQFCALIRQLTYDDDCSCLS